MAYFPDNPTEERLWNHIADRKQHGDIVGATFCATHPDTSSDANQLLTLADTVHSALEADAQAQRHQEVARTRLAALIATDLPAPPLSRPGRRVANRRGTFLPQPRQKMALLTATLLMLAALASALGSWRASQPSLANTVATRPTSAALLSTSSASCDLAKKAASPLVSPASGNQKTISPPVLKHASASTGSSEKPRGSGNTLP